MTKHTWTASATFAHESTGREVKVGPVHASYPEDIAWIDAADQLGELLYARLDEKTGGKASSYDLVEQTEEEL